MPVEHKHTIKAGATRQLVFLYARDERDPETPKTGMVAEIATATAAFVREGEPVVFRVDLSEGRLGEWSAGSIAEADADLMPGVYQYGLPNELIAEGSTRAMLCLRFNGALIAPVEISLVAFDPQDSERIGVWGLANHKRHEFLRRALPRLTEMEYELGEKAENALRKQLSQARTD
jgi:hypothetical protein